MGVFFRSTLLVGAALAALYLHPGQTSARTWTNDQGQTLEADFVRLRLTTAFLRNEEGDLIRAPIDRLSEEDQQWIDTYKGYIGLRSWGDPANDLRGRFTVLRDDHVEVRVGGERQEITFADLTFDDFAHLEALHAHLEEELPGAFLAAKKAATPPPSATPPEDAVEREWTDARGRKIKATYAGTTGDKAILWIKGKRFDYPLERLSEADRSWVAQQNLAKLTGDLQGGWLAASSFVSTAVGKTIAEKGPPPMAMQPGPPMAMRGQPQAPGADRFGRGGFAAPTPTPQPNEFAAAPAPAADMAYQAPEPPVTLPAEEPASAAPAASGDLHPDRGAPPWIDDYYNLSPNEADARLREAFGDWLENDEPIAGEAYCSHCDGEFAYPEGFGTGDTCPFCGTTMVADDLVAWEDFDVDYSSGTPWYLRRFWRRLIIAVVIAAIGAGIKFATGGGDD